MIHQTTTTRHRDSQGRTYYLTKCTCAIYEIITGTRAHGEAYGRKHERSAR